MGWDRSIAAELARMKASLAEVVQEAARVAARSIITYTPVDTGRLAGNWQGAINAEPPTARLQDDPSKQFTLTFFEALVEKIELGDQFVMTNATPYAEFINDGTSKTPPRKMVERGAADAANAVRSRL